jgi:hypothetical protein
MTPPYLSVIVPAYNCVPTLTRTLAALGASDLARSEWELIVADDGSTDQTGATASRMADRVVRLPDGPSGPAAARNRGAALATGEVLVFVDADVCVAPTTLSQFAALFRGHPSLGAAFGSYDATPEAPDVVSQYRNLLHHYVHTTSPGPAVTFWAGCGAMRRTVFTEAGGYDAARYRRPQIEDIELGYRLTARGVPIVLCPEITGTHLKRWTFRGGVVTDFRDRGVPWMHLILERGEVAAAGPLNLAAREKAFTVLAGIGAMSGLAALAFRSWMAVAVMAGAFTIILVGNRPLLGWYRRMRGPRFALAIIPLRLVYYTQNGVAAAWAIAGHVLRGRGRPGRASNGTDDKFLSDRPSH